MLIGFGYKKFSGKDTAADYLVKEHGFVKDGFAVDLKQEVQDIWHKTILTWAKMDENIGLHNEYVHGNSSKGGFVRWLIWKKKPPFIVSLLQNHGTELRRAEDPAYWTKKVISRYILSGRPDTVVADVRYPNEAEAIHGQGGILIRLDRTVDRAEFGTHTSETSLDEFKGWDYILENNRSKYNLFGNLDAILAAIKSR